MMMLSISQKLQYLFFFLKFCGPPQHPPLPPTPPFSLLRPPLCTAPTRPPIVDASRPAGRGGDRPVAMDRPCSDQPGAVRAGRDRKSTRLNSSHANISYAVFCLKKKNSSYHFAEYTILVC